MRYFFFVAAMLSGTYLLAQHPEATAIQKTIEAETQAQLTESLAEVAKKYWILDDKTVRCISYVDGTTYQHKAADLLTETEIPPVSHATFEKTNFVIEVVGDIAYVTNHQVVNLAEEGQNQQFSHEIRVLEKVNGQWKIHLLSAHQYDPTKPDGR
jgi:antirestriction protein ArdC